VTHPTPNLLQRLRRHKGGWVLLFAALMIKIAASTVCVFDGARVASTPTVPGDAVTVSVLAAEAVAADNDLCLLGEGSGCHCACAHGAALPMTTPVVAAVVVPDGLVRHVPSAPTALYPPSLLRPPIA
jgi:nitrous oxidase accessory protein NosD